MIRYELECADGDRFEAWFRNSADYDEQEAQGLLMCPHCGTAKVGKAVMAPAVLRGAAKEREARAALREIAAKSREHIAKNYAYVGDKFADEVRAMSEGEAEQRLVWGEAKPEEAKALIEEGAPVAPIPPGFAPPKPDEVN
jgi:hypothetical protein